MSRKNSIAGILILSIVVVLGFFTMVFLQQPEVPHTRSVKKDTPRRERYAEVFVYETEADSADECSSYETFDPDEYICYFECRNETECTEIKNAIDEELDSWVDELEDEEGFVHDENMGEGEEWESDGALAVYDVTRGEEITLRAGEDAEEYVAIWESIAELAPSALSDAYIDTYQVFENPSDDTIAFVDDQNDDGKWRIAINLGMYYEGGLREQRATLIHELAHILTLNRSQFSAKEPCVTLALDEGCATKNAYLYRFWDVYWKNNPTQTYTENHFVTEYAATSETEDFAESFAFFVLDGKNSSSTAVRDEKVRSFYAYPELVTMRQEMRDVLESDIIRARKLIK